MLRPETKDERLLPRRRVHDGIVLITRPLLIYDGECSFCTAWATWVARQSRGRVRIVAWQSLEPDELAALGLTVDDTRAAAWWFDENGRRARGHLAIAHALAVGHGWPALLGRALLLPPFRWAGAAVYPVVARWRARLPRPYASDDSPGADRPRS
jgi:predicted DCC family thiol-disulfide oxidoreductase YuxK